MSCGDWTHSSAHAIKTQFQLGVTLLFILSYSGYTADFAVQLATTTYTSALQSLKLTSDEQQVKFHFEKIKNLFYACLKICWCFLILSILFSHLFRNLTYFIVTFLLLSANYKNSIRFCRERCNAA